MEAIFKRRSVRRYAKEEVPEESLHKILEAAMNAPSAGNEQPWHFVVIRDKQTLGELSGCSPHASMLKDAPLGILVLADLLLERHKGYWVQDCSAAVENMLIAVAGLGLGAVWLGIYPVEDRISSVKKLFGLPENIMPFAVVPVGFPLEPPRPVNRFNQARVHSEKW